MLVSKFSFLAKVKSRDRITDVEMVQKNYSSAFIKKKHNF